MADGGLNAGFLLVLTRMGNGFTSSVFMTALLTTASIYVDGKLPENGNLNPKTGIAGEGGYCEGVNNTPTAPLYLRGGKETFTGILDDGRDVGQTT